MQLFEQYRPRTWDELVGQDKVRGTIDRMRRRGLAGQAYWITGASGTGKSTIARLIANEVAEPWAIEELDSQWLTAARLADIEKQISGRPLGGIGWALIVNEAHGLSAAAVRALLVALERIPGHATWIFTTTTDGQASLIDGCEDSGPLLSRCTILPLARRDLSKPMAARLQEINAAESLPDKPVEFFVKLLQANQNNMRAALSAIQAGATCV